MAPLSVAMSSLVKATMQQSHLKRFTIINSFTTVFCPLTRALGNYRATCYMILLVFVIPISLLILSIVLVIQLTFYGSFISTVINTIYYCVFVAIMSTTGHPNSQVTKVRWRDEWQGIWWLLITNLGVTLLLSWLVSAFKN